LTPEGTKQLLVDAIRMLERSEIIDFNGHCSVRAGNGRMLINSGKSVRSTLTVADIVAIDFEGRLVDGADAPPMEFHIHSEIYRKRPDVNAVVHAHPKWSTFLTIAGHRLKPVYAQGCLLGDVPVFEDPLSINTKAMGERLAAALGGARAMLLRSHGAVVVGSDLVEAFVLAVYLEENAHRQYMAQQIGEPYVFSAEERRACIASLWKPHLFAKAWDYYASRLR
jgi:L-fuculose-phosphate aldolase